MGSTDAKTNPIAADPGAADRHRSASQVIPRGNSCRDSGMVSNYRKNLEHPNMGFTGLSQVHVGAAL